MQRRGDPPALAGFLHEPDRLHWRLALARPVAGQVVDVQRPEAERAVVAVVPVGVGRDVRRAVRADEPVFSARRERLRGRMLDADDLDGDVAAVGGLVGDLRAGLRAHDRRSQGRLGGVDAQPVVPAISGSRAGTSRCRRLPANLTVITVPVAALETSFGALADRGLAQQVGQLPDAGLLLALLVLGRVVAAVLLEVASSRRALISADIAARPATNASSSAFSRSWASWVSQTPWDSQWGWTRGCS